MRRANRSEKKMKHKEDDMKRVGLLFVMVTLSFVAAGCQGGAEPTTEAPPPATAAPAATEAPPPTEAPPEQALGTINKGERVVGDTLELTSDELAVLSANAPGNLIGIVATTLETEYHALLNETLQARGEELGFDVEIFDSQTEAEREIQGLEGFISKGAEAIILTGIAGEALGPAVQEAIDAGIVVVQLTGRSLSEFGAITVAVENITIGEEEGRAAGRYAANTYPGEEVEVIILDFPSYPSLVERADAIERGMLEVNSDINVVGRFLGGLPDNGVTSIETALQQFPDLRGITGINDGGNMGAYQALLAAGRTPEDTFIFGIDCDPGAVDLIDEGTMYAGCIDTNPAGTGVIAVNVFAKYWAGGTVPEIIEVPVNVYTGG